MLLNRNKLQLVLMLVAIGAVCCCAQPGPNPDPEEHWFTQQFDHFNPADTRTFQQRYLVYTGYYQNQSQAPALFFTAGGESDVYGGYKHNGFQFELAQKIGAFILYVEHRFYGNTLPFGPVDSYKPGIIDKLTVEQALADYAAVITYVRKAWRIPAGTPTIAWGGSYAGELVTYMRAGYPDVIDASVAGSAPLKYHEGFVPNGQYFKVTTEDFAGTNPGCPAMVQAAFSEMAAKAQTSAGRAWITSELMLCSPLQPGDDALRMVNLWAENAFASLAMLDYPWPNPNTLLPAYPIDTSCSVMASTKGSFTRKLGKALGVLYNATLDLPCFNISEEYYPCADITGCGGGVGDPNAMSWDYQSCSEVVSNVDTNNVTDMFPAAPYDMDALISYCQDTWGATPDPLHLSEVFNYTSATRIIFSNGLLDPWWPGGILQSSPELEQWSIMIERAAHHLDFYGTDPVNDPISVTLARIQEEEIIVGWIQEIWGERMAKKL